MTRKAVPLAEIRKTQFARRLSRTASRECWGAETVDGVWEFEREDSPGTPWLIWHRASVADGSWAVPVMQCGTLRACRALVASGGAATELTVRKAEAAGWVYDSSRRCWFAVCGEVRAEEGGSWAEAPAQPPPHMIGCTCK